MLHQLRSLSIPALLFVAMLIAACQPVVASSGRALSAVERHYHQESTARMDLPEVVAVAAPAALAVRQLSAAERHYHQESVARVDLPWAVVSAVPAAREMSLAEQYYRATMSHLVTAAPAVRELSVEERHYHQESVARRDLAWPAQQVASIPAVP